MSNSPHDEEHYRERLRKMKTPLLDRISELAGYTELSDSELDARGGTVGKLIAQLQVAAFRLGRESLAELNQEPTQPTETTKPVDGCSTRRGDGGSDGTNTRVDGAENQYFDADGRRCSLDVMVKREPEWAANRLRRELATVERLAGEVERLENAAPPRCDEYPSCTCNLYESCWPESEPCKGDPNAT